MEQSDTPGRNLERFVRDRWRLLGGKRGMVGVCEASGVTREALYVVAYWTEWTSSVIC